MHKPLKISDSYISTYSPCLSKCLTKKYKSQDINPTNAVIQASIFTSKNNTKEKYIRQNSPITLLNLSPKLNNPHFLPTAKAAKLIDLKALISLVKYYLHFSTLRFHSNGPIKVNRSCIFLGYS